ncbi:acetylornithine transaminase, partial [Micromonospora sp. NPDC049799]
EAGFLVNPVQAGVLRLAPPLVLTAAQADAFLAALPAALDATVPAAAPAVDPHAAAPAPMTPTSTEARA